MHLIFLSVIQQIFIEPQQYTTDIAGCWVRRARDMMYFVFRSSCQSTSIYWAQRYAWEFASCWGFRDVKTYFLWFPEFVGVTQKQCSRCEICTLVVLAFSGCNNKNTLDWVIYKWLLLTVMESGKPRLNLPANSVSVKRLFFLDSTFQLYAQNTEGQRDK